MTDSSRSAQVSFSTLLAELVPAQRVLWVGCPEQGALDPWLTRGAQLRLLLPAESVRPQPVLAGVTIAGTLDELAAGDLPEGEAAQAELLIVGDGRLLVEEATALDEGQCNALVEKRLRRLLPLLSPAGAFAVGLSTQDDGQTLAVLARQLQPFAPQIFTWGQKRVATSVWSPMDRHSSPEANQRHDAPEANQKHDAPETNQGHVPPEAGQALEVIFADGMAELVPDHCVLLALRGNHPLADHDQLDLDAAWLVADTLSDDDVTRRERSEKTDGPDNPRDGRETIDPDLLQLEAKQSELADENRELRRRLGVSDAVLRDLLHELERSHADAEAVGGEGVTGAAQLPMSESTRSPHQGLLPAIDQDELERRAFEQGKRAVLDRALDAEATCADLRAQIVNLRASLEAAECQLAAGEGSPASKPPGASEPPAAGGLPVVDHAIAAGNGAGELSTTASVATGLPVESVPLLESQLQGLQARAAEQAVAISTLQSRSAALQDELERAQTQRAQAEERCREREIRGDGLRDDLVRAHEEVVRLRASEQSAAEKLREASAALDALTEEALHRDESVGKSDAPAEQANLAAAQRLEEGSRDALENLKKLLGQLRR